MIWSPQLAVPLLQCVISLLC
uniref:Uncharacterized protein n=1 Tax=Anguilla anguilla TaxID=7936 RepID=A0A0E9QJN2_ANGAN